MKLSISYSDAVNYLEKTTYLLAEDAAQTIKLMIHAEKFRKQIGRKPTQEELLRIAEYVGNDKTLAYLNEELPVELVTNLAKATNKTPPNLRK